MDVMSISAVGSAYTCITVEDWYNHQILNLL